MSETIKAPITSKADALEVLKNAGAYPYLLITFGISRANRVRLVLDLDTHISFDDSTARNVLNLDVIKKGFWGGRSRDYRIQILTDEPEHLDLIAEAFGQTLDSIEYVEGSRSVPHVENQLVCV